MKRYLIDGNNLIHKSKELVILQKKDPQRSRERLAFMIDNYFINKNADVILFYDGFGSLPIKTNKIRIIYSENATADEKIKASIERAANPKNVVVVTSDGGIRNLARKCSCGLMKSEEFKMMLDRNKKVDEEEQKIKDMDADEFKKIFGADK